MTRFVTVMDGKVKIIDPSVKDELLRFPTVELIHLLFPDVQMKGRSVLCNPLRGEQHASLSCFRSYDGYPRWKDHATGQVGDNIDFFRLANPDLGYVEAVDALARLVLGRSALGEADPSTQRPVLRSGTVPAVHVPVVETPGALRICGVRPYSPESTPSELVAYTRSRGISDEVARAYLRHVSFVNTHAEGRSVIDSRSGLPVLDEKGRIEKQTGRSESLGMPNDIGGFSLRTPDSVSGKGFKGTNASFLTTILSDGSYLCPNVSLRGSECPFVRFFYYDEPNRNLYVNEGVFFEGVQPWAVRFAVPFLDDWSGRYLEGRDLRCAVAVLSSLNRVSCGKAVLVEGMFDALSLLEMERLSRRSLRPGSDLVVLNSTSNLRWALPFLSAHSEVVSYLDNDMRSATGQKSFASVEKGLSDMSFRTGFCPVVRNGSYLFYPHKDVNEYLMARKGFSPKGSSPADGIKKKKTAVNDRKSNLKI